MINREIIESYISNAEKYIALSVDQETSYYKIGAIDKGKRIRNKIIYLEFYTFVLTELLLFYDVDLDYTDYDITDEQVWSYMYYVDEVIKVLFN